MALLKLLGYALSGIGILGILLSSEKFKGAIPILKTLPTTIILIGSLILVAAGIVIMIVTGKGKIGGGKEKEVPIYKGKEVVGYRRI
jgi:hypothetical protein